MFALRLHAFGWDRPHCGLKINFIPWCSDYLSSSRRSQNCKFESTCCRTVTTAQLTHEFCDVWVGQGAVMNNLLNKRSGGQHLIQVAPPTGRIFSRPPASDLGKVKHCFDPTTNAICGFGLIAPNILQRLQDKGC